MSIAAYKSTIRSSESPRQIERRILSRLTGQLEARAADYDTAEGSHERIEILSSGLRRDLTENQRFWGELRHDLSQPGNALPAELRAGLLSIAIFVERQTNAVIGGAPGVSALVGINRSIVAGMAGQAPAAGA